jgi:hypothetical protein
MFAPTEKFVHTVLQCNQILQMVAGDIWGNNMASHLMLKHRQEKLQQPTTLHQTSQQRLRADLAKIQISTHYYPQSSRGLILSTKLEMLLTQHFL